MDVATMFRNEGMLKPLKIFMMQLMNYLKERE